MISGNNEEENKKNFLNYYHQSFYMCKEINNNIEKNYQKGKNEAYNEILQWLSNNYANDKTISVNGLNMFLQDKLNKVNNDIEMYNGGSSNNNNNSNSNGSVNKNNGFDMNGNNNAYEEDMLSNPNMWTFVSSTKRKK